jgi:hypothetical protein
LELDEYLGDVAVERMHLEDAPKDSPYAATALGLPASLLQKEAV